MAAPVSYSQNTLVLIASETLANSLGGTMIASNVQVSNVTPNGANSMIEFTLAGQSLPVPFGSINNYPPVTVSVYAGSNGNTQDTLLMTGTVFPTQDQGGGFIVNGTLTLRANAKAAGANANQVWGGTMQVPGTALGGDAKTITNIYAGAASNGNVNVTLFNANTCNIGFFVQPQTAQNTNASITALIVYAPQSVI